MREWLTTDDDANETWLIAELTRALSRIFDFRARDIGLTRAQASILACLRRFPGKTQVELADWLAVPQITLTRQLDRLEKGGWVVRKLDRNDRRLRRLYLTAESGTVNTRLQAMIMELRHCSLVDFSKEEHEALIKSLLKIRKNLLVVQQKDCGDDR